VTEIADSKLLLSGSPVGAMGKNKQQHQNIESVMGSTLQTYIYNTFLFPSFHTIMKIAVNRRLIHGGREQSLGQPCYNVLPLSPGQSTQIVICFILLLICFIAMPLPHAIFTLLHVSSFPSAVHSCQCVIDVLFVTLFIVVPS
jgi:hypothetical protein